MLKLTLRNLLARKVRLVMSGLAIVLGVAFLSGVLVFSNGLSSTFDGIIYSSTPDAVVGAPPGAGTRKRPLNWPAWPAAPRGVQSPSWCTTTDP